MKAAKMGFTPGAIARPIEESPDMWLATRAKIVLQTTEGVNLTEGIVEATQGVVTLHGRVKSAAERARAGLAVGSIDGVLGVRNFLQIPDQPVTVEVRPPDEVLKERVEEALKSDGNQQLEGVKVEGVNDGVIHMSGKGVTLTGGLRAVQLAWDAADEADEGEGTESLASDLGSDAEPRTNDKGEKL